ncbi:flagellar type III secretion system pore protein FliP [Paracoccus sp. (in: a-proteobacteria)]|uniref:flagellar type III secretion system pore protein FliP n=1 Tax=Paracoccus sp. TaxID=267 RepID=UPI00321FA75F
MIRLALILALAVLPQAVAAQDLPMPAAAGVDALANGVGRHTVTLLAVMTALALAPGIAIMVTCFPFIVTVLSILRQSMGLQQSPPNMLIVSLAMFLTWFVMNPVLTEAWNVAGAPLRDGQISVEEAFSRGIQPFRGFMETRTDPQMLSDMAGIAPGRDAAPDRLSVLVPAFMLSEIQRAFEIGFLVSLPFLIIDLVVSAVLMSMGMMMVPPAVVALPFKLAFFLVVDGWGLIASALVRSYQ